MPEDTPKRHNDGPVPLFGSWPRIYGAVVACAITVMALLTLFSGWPY
jgi:hypothetical protein